MLAIPPDGITIVALVIVAFVGGIGIATVGPGGIFVTIALVLLTGHAPGTIAGTMSAALFLGGLLGTVAYWRSGELATRDGRRLAITVSVASGFGAFTGSQLNALLTPETFGPVLAVFVLLTGLLLFVRNRGGFQPLFAVDVESVRGRGVIVGIGAAVGLPSGLLGVGGPVLAVPLLVLVNVPLLAAVGSAQLLSSFVAGAATAGYLVRGTVDPGLFGIVALPLLLGIGVGWRIAHRVEAARLQRVLAAALLVVGGYLLL